MMKLTDLAAFVRIAETGSLTAAAKSLGISTTTVSERLSALEMDCGARLIRRTTRSLNLTEEGRLLLEGARRLLDDARHLEATLRDRSEALSGSIRLSAPRDLGRRFVLSTIDRFQDEHADVRVDLIFSDENVDFAVEGVDFAIRDGISPDRALQCRPLVENRRIVCASPDYLARRGAPLHPSDLAAHDCLGLRVGGSVARFWRFVINGRETGAPLSIVRSANDAELIAEWCRQGRGIAVKSYINVAEDLAAGRLVALLGEFMPPPGALHVVHPIGRAPPRRVQVLLDMIEAEITSFQPPLPTS